MKTGIVLTGIALIALNLTGCKSDAEKQAEKNVDRYTAYVDSVTNIASSDAKTNWDSFEAGYKQRADEVEASMANMKDRSKADEKMAAAKAKYDEFKSKVEAEVMADKKAAMPDTGASMRTAFFGEKMGEDMSFGWVNKDNILAVYEQFVLTYQNNRKSYSEADFNKVKTWYDALNDRKDKVEKEGLSTGDNLKIAAIKLKFAPTLRFEKGVEKISENSDSKK